MLILVDPQPIKKKLRQPGQHKELHTVMGKEKQPPIEINDYDLEP